MNPQINDEGRPVDESGGLEAMGVDNGSFKVDYTPKSDNKLSRLLANAVQKARAGDLALILEELPAIAQPDDPANVLYTDLGNARRFTLEHGAHVRCVYGWGWTAWSGKQWEIDKTGNVRVRAQATADNMHAQAVSDLDNVNELIERLDKAEKTGETLAALVKLAEIKDRAIVFYKWAVMSQSTARLSAMLTEAAALCPGLPDEFDQDPWLLNCQNGVIDLKTGLLLKHNPKYRITHICNASYDPQAKSELWQKHNERVFRSYPELIGYMKQLAGYTLTGKTGEQIAPFLHGFGSNGKSRYVEALFYAMGSYAVKISAKALMSGDNNRINDEIAKLPGKRFILSSEVDEGQRLNEALVKELTGDEIVTARRLYQDTFEFRIIGKLWMFGNHKPAIRGTDSGIWRRQRLVPFVETISDSEKIADFGEQLKNEADGILAWAVMGCLEWQKNGLQTPDIVDQETKKYRSEQDILAMFIDERCVLSSIAKVTAGALYDEYKRWAADSGMGQLSKIKFSRQLAERGIKTNDRQPGTGRYLYSGIALRSDEKPIL